MNKGERKARKHLRDLTKMKLEHEAAARSLKWAIRVATAELKRGFGPISAMDAVDRLIGKQAQ